LAADFEEVEREKMGEGTHGTFHKLLFELKEAYLD